MIFLSISSELLSDAGGIDVWLFVARIILSLASSSSSQITRTKTDLSSPAGSSSWEKC